MPVDRKVGGSSPSSFTKRLAQWVERKTDTLYVTGSNPVSNVPFKHNWLGTNSNKWGSWLLSRPNWQSCEASAEGGVREAGITNTLCRPRIPLVGRS